MTAISLSFNEVELLSRKAAMGAGLPSGVAEELGQAARWLAARSFDGLAIVTDALESHSEGHGSSRHPAVEALRLLDALPATDSTIPVDGAAIPPLLFLGLAGVLAGSENIEVELRCDGVTLTTGDASVADGHGNLVEPVTALRRRPRQELPAAVLARPHPVSRAVIDAAERFAKRTYVPASDASRHRGAGSAAGDND